MVDFKFNFGFLENYKQIFAENQENPSPEVQALTNLMTITGIYRLFEKEDVYELVKRAQLIFPERDMITDFFNEDILLDFYFENEIHKLDINTLKEFIGYEFADVNTNQEAFENWAINIPHFKFQAGLISTRAGILNLDTSRSNVSGVNNDVKIDYVNFPDDIPFTHDDVKKAEAFAKVIMKEIPSSAFDRLKEEFPNKFKELELRNAPFDEPVFDFESFPEEKQKQMWMHFFPDMEHFDDAPTREYYERLIHLAWLWANGFVIDEDVNAIHLDYRIIGFDQEELATEDENNDLLNISMLHNLDELFPLLRDPEVFILSVRPWEKLDVYSRD